MLLCGGVAGASYYPPFGGVLRLGLSEVPDVIDPLDSRTFEDRLLTVLTHNGLYELDSRGEPAPRLVDRHDLSPDGKTYVFTLRGNIRFHSGRPLEAQDVVYSLKRAAGDPVVGALLMDVAGYPDVPDIKAKDAHTVTVRLSRWQPKFLHFLAQPGLFIVERDMVTKGAGSWGTGPFRFTAGRMPVLRAFEAHFQGRPYLNAIQLVPHGREEDRMLDFKRDLADALSLGPAGAHALKARWVTTPQPEVYVLDYGCQVEDAAKTMLSQSLEREGLLKVFFRQQGRVVNTLEEALTVGAPLSASVPAKKKPKKKKPAEPSKAPKKDGEGKTWTVTYGSACGEACEAIAGRLCVGLERRGLMCQVRPGGAAGQWDARVRRVLPAGSDPLTHYRLERGTLTRCQGRPPMGQASETAAWVKSRRLSDYLVGVPAHFGVTPAFHGVGMTPYNVPDLSFVWRREETP